MHRGGVRRLPDDREHGQGGRGRGGRRHPSGLTGKEIGLWYARKGQKHKKERELKERPIVTMNREKEIELNTLLNDMRKDRHDSIAPNRNSSTSTGSAYHRSDMEDVTSMYSNSHQQQLITLSASDRQDGERPKGCWTSSAASSNLYSKTFDAYVGEVNHSSPHIPKIEPIAELDETLMKELHDKKTCGSYQSMLEFRKKLPSYSMKEELVNLINSNQVVVISGETGCGKTTQVPQFILDNAIERGSGSTCRIICTQPRRISAISVAERVASERADKCGDDASVGYQIRLESKRPRDRGSIIYCTTGVVLRWLVSDPYLTNTSHLILDEVHERDLMTDFLLIIVKDLLKRRPDLRFVLMSATLNAELFSSYFDKCPTINIPGFTYPVEELYLEDVVEKIGYKVVKGQDDHLPHWKRRRNDYREKAKTKRTKQTAMETGEENVDWIDEEERHKKEWEDYLVSLRQTYSHQTVETVSNMTHENIDLDLLEKLVRYICQSEDEGAILIFLPGWDDISKLHDKLSGSTMFRSSNFIIIPLHSMMPTVFQQQIFQRPPPGVRKIVIATNIAETSITIDDVVFVIDAGKVKETTYDAANNLACLEPVWISKAASRQRRGRAGRVKPGKCYHLFTEFKAARMIDYQLPEMLRTPLEELCLQVKILKLGYVAPFLSKALQPPASDHVASALQVLTDLNAIDFNEALTPLGYHLASLPVNPRIGKMILFGAIFSCLDPVLIVASNLGFKEPFVIPLHKQKQADEVKLRFANGSRSDHVALIHAFEGWEKATRTGNDGRYCWDNFLSSNILKLVQDMKRQFSGLLFDSGFVISSDPKHPSSNLNSHDMKIVKGVLCAGLYPNVIKVEHRFNNRRPPKLSTKDGIVHFHPKSVNSDVTHFDTKWLIYHHKMKSSKVFIHDSSMISPYPLLFFGGSIEVLTEDNQDLIVVDGWIKFRARRRIANLVREMKEELDKLLEQKIARPSTNLTVTKNRRGSKEMALIQSIIDLISQEEHSTSF